MFNINKTIRNSVMGMVITAASIGAVTTPSYATETINMIAIDGYPARAMWVKEFSGFFIPRVNEELAATGNYKINWQEGYLYQGSKYL